ncbi:MAG: hypothetical protein ACXVCA_09195 [Bdellovibrio sp.]
MFQLILSFFAVAAFGTFSHADENTSLAVMPAGTIPKGSTFTVEPSNSSVSYFDPAVMKTNLDPAVTKTNGNELFEQIKADSLYQIQSINTTDSSLEMADLKLLIARQQLMIQQNQMQNNPNLNCMQAGAGLNCTALTNIPAFNATPFNFADQYANLIGTSNVSPPFDSTNESHSMVHAVQNRVFETNKKISDAGKPCEEKNLEYSTNEKMNCGIKQALDVYKKAKKKGEITNEVFIFNDFSNGSVTGKMWFINSNGSLANILDKNPIDVAGGEGGYGNEDGKLKTPDGALKTLPYRYRKEKQIKDAIALAGLEENNKNALARGILIHAWSPYAPTLGCLGMPGSYDSSTAGKRDYGGTPKYYDQLRDGFLKNGGVMIYNFTPNKAKACSVAK